jgi:hypothetical protein
VRSRSELLLTRLIHVDAVWTHGYFEASGRVAR